MLLGVSHAAGLVRVWLGGTRLLESFFSFPLPLPPPHTFLPPFSSPPLVSFSFHPPSFFSVLFLLPLPPFFLFSYLLSQFPCLPAFLCGFLSFCARDWTQGSLHPVQAPCPELHLLLSSRSSHHCSDWFLTKVLSIQFFRSHPFISGPVTSHFTSLLALLQGFPRVFESCAWECLSLLGKKMRRSCLYYALEFWEGGLS